MVHLLISAQGIVALDVGLRLVGAPSSSLPQKPAL